MARGSSNLAPLRREQLAFARFRSTLTLVEPIPRVAKDQELPENLPSVLRHARVEHADVEGFTTDRRFDIVDARGLYLHRAADQPVVGHLQWSAQTPGGLLVVELLERCGSIMRP